MGKKIIEKNLESDLSFDLYGRYAIVRAIINNNRSNGKKFRVLDVGGRGNLLQEFLPDDDVYYLDPLIESDDKNFISGDGCSMPLEDESFDWVTSADVFEHIPEERREDFLEENIRVAKLGVVLVAPFWSLEVEHAEFNANENYKNYSGEKDHMWLREHIENGLPKENDVEKFVRCKDLHFQKLHNNRLFLWECVLAMNFLISDCLDEEIIRKLSDFNNFYNTKVFPYDNGGPSYRKIYFIKKDSSLQNLSINKKDIDDVLFLDVIKKMMDLIGFVDLKKNQQIINQNQQILNKNKEIEGKNEEIFLMKSSKFWKMRGYYVQIKNFLRIS